MNSQSKTHVILSVKYPQFAAALQQRGYHVISSETIEGLITYESDHADMQVLILDETAFVMSRCKRLAEFLSEKYHVIPCAENIRSQYPSNIALNCAVIGKTVIARTDAMDPQVREYCQKHDYQIIHVRQGYAKCSCAIVSENAIITEDQSIIRALQGTKIDVLPIKEGRVRLDGAPYGFIGGASGLNNCGEERVMYFCGDITRHPDYNSIKSFCDQCGTKIDCLTDDELTDIGGMLFC